jgi:hypothetical protein
MVKNILEGIKYVEPNSSLTTPDGMCNNCIGVEKESMCENCKSEILDIKND